MNLSCSSGIFIKRVIFQMQWCYVVAVMAAVVATVVYSEAFHHHHHHHRPGVAALAFVGVSVCCPSLAHLGNDLTNSI